MDMHSLIHHAPAAPASNNLRFAGAAALPGLRAHFPSSSSSSSSSPPSLPIRLPAFRPASPPHCHSVAPLAAPQDLHRSPIAGSNATTASTTTLAPLRFIIPSTHCGSSSMPLAFTSAAVSTETTAFPSASAIPPASESMPSPHTFAPATNNGDASCAVANASEPTTATLEKKTAPKRSRVVKNANRSTKSKARPGLRKGKWTDEESRYATQLTYYFKEGLLPIERGTMLRLYLSQKLNCEPMRITKKFTGVECIGKQVFRPCTPSPEARVRLMQAQLELVALEAAFIKKLKENHEDAPSSSSSSGGSTDDCSARQPTLAPRHNGSSTDDDEGFTSDSSSASSAAATSSSSLSSSLSFARSGAAMTAILKKPTAAAKPVVVDDAADSASAVGLLLDFFYKANHSEAAEGATSGSDSDSVAGSPTKRIRALSISAAPGAECLSKRSRVGSFAAAAAVLA